MAARSQATSEADPLPVDRPSGPGRSGAARKPPQRVQSGPLKHKHAYGGSSARHLPMKTASPVTSSVCGSQRAAGAARAAHKVSGAGGKSKLHFSEVRGDLFSCPATASLAHCVSEDMAMGKGIATVFKKRFGGVRELKEQGAKTGGLAVLEREERYIYYLVTKPRHFHKPTYETLESSLHCLRGHCQSHGIRELCMPRIGCGLDRLEWGKVAEMIQTIFTDCEISITIYYL